MRVDRKTLRLLLIGGAIGGVLGIIIGLVVFGWWLWPVEWTDAAPDSLRVEYKELFLRSAIDSFTVTQDLDTAKKLVEYIGSDTLSIVESIQANPRDQEPASIRVFISLAKGYNLEDIAGGLVTQAAPTVVDVEITRVVPQLVTSTPRPSSTPNPLSQTVAPIGPGRVLAYLISADNAGIETLSKLVGLGFRDGVEVQVFSNEEEYLVALDEADVRGALYAGTGYSAAALRELSNFANNGGRVLFFYDGDWLQQNDLLQDRFGVSLVIERVKEVKDQLIFDQAMLPDWASGLEVGVSRTGQEQYITAHAISAQDPDQAGYLISDETNKERLLYLSTMDGRVAFFPRTYLFENLINEYQYFFDDANIDFYDNEQAARGMLNFLAGK